MSNNELSSKRWSGGNLTEALIAKEKLRRALYGKTGRTGSTTNRNLSRKGPHGTPGTSGSPESLIHVPPTKMGTSVFPIPKPPMRSLLNLLPLVSMDLQLLRSVMYVGIMLPQAQQGVGEFFGIFVAVIGIIFVIFGFVGDIPCGC